jgi:Icc-related predicted phosphoesterase
MLRIVVFGDIHAEQQRLGSTLELLEGLEFDLALVAGDVGSDPPWRSPARETERQAHDDSVRETLERVAAYVCAPVLFVPGNHDLRDPVDGLPAVNCDRTIVEAAGLRVAGFGGAGPTRFGFPYEWSEEEADAALGSMLGATAGVDVLLSHSPPRDCALDVTYRGAHVGSAAVHEWIGKSRPRLVVCGHIHEAWGVERVEGVPCINAGAMGEPCPEELVFTVDWGEDGPVRFEALRRTGRGVERKTWPAADPGAEK